MMVPARQASRLANDGTGVGEAATLRLRRTGSLLPSQCETYPPAHLVAFIVTLGEVENVIRGIARFLVVITVIIAVIFIVWGGVMWMAARGDDEMAGRAKKTIINGIIGALVVLGVGVILQTLAAIVTRTFFGPFMG